MFFEFWTGFAQMMKQLRLWPDDTQKVVVEIHKTQDGFMAVLAGGWWIGFGSTPQRAARNAVKRYQDEARL